MNPTLISFAAAALLSLAAAYTDLRTGLIPNRIIVLGLGAALLIHLSAPWLLQSSEVDALDPALSIGYALVGLLVCALTPLILFRLGAMGGGDVKLLAVVGALVGPVLGMEIQLNAFVLIAIFAAARLVYRGTLLKLFASTLSFALGPLTGKGRQRAVPPELLSSTRFAPAVLVALVLVFGVRLVAIPPALH